MQMRVGMLKGWARSLISMPRSCTSHLDTIPMMARKALTLSKVEEGSSSPQDGRVPSGGSACSTLTTRRCGPGGASAWGMDCGGGGDREAAASSGCPRLLWRMKGARERKGSEEGPSCRKGTREKMLVITEEGCCCCSAWTTAALSFDGVSCVASLPSWRGLREQESAPSSGRCKGKVLCGERRSVATRVSILQVDRCGGVRV